MTDLDKRLSLQEQEIKYIRDDVCEVKDAMKQHMDDSKKSSDKLHTKMDMVIWAMVIGLAGIITKIVFFS